MQPARPRPLRFASVGSVDDGKSTLIGRLLHDSKSIFEDQLEHIEAVSKRRGTDYVDLALLTDGLRAEREQGITIDVAYRYFSTPHRDFVIADCPGHIQYTRNMVTGASTADLAIVLIDARHGVVEQTRRHSLLVSLLGVPHLVICVNKMDLVEYSEERFDEIREQFTEFAVAARAARRDVHPDLGARRRQRRRTLRQHEVVRRHDAAAPPRVGVRRLRRQPDRRPLPGAVRDPPADRRAPRLPRLRRSGRRRRDEAGRRGGRAAVGIHVDDRQRSTRPTAELDEATPGMAVTVRLADDIDISRGDMICRPHNQPRPTQDLEAMLCWMDSTARCSRARCTPSSTPPATCGRW